MTRMPGRDVSPGALESSPLSILYLRFIEFFAFFGIVFEDARIARV